jgi:uncharacterized membrane protein
MARTVDTRLFQRGATAVSMLLLMLFLISMLGMVEVSYLYWAKRDTQKVTDLAALAGAQQLNACAADNSNNTAARGNATVENKFPTTGTLTIQCGTWDPLGNAGISDHFSTTPAGSSPNAVKVVAQHPTVAILNFAGTLPNVNATAVAAGQQPTAVFSIGSTLATVSGNATLGQLLAGIGLNIPNASLVGYAGLANATVTPSGLLNQLGVKVPANLTAGGLNQFLASSVQAHALIDVLNATVNAAGQQQLVSANATLVNAVTTALGSPPGPVTLGSNGTTSGLFAQITTPDAGLQSALNAQVNALQLIYSSIGVATGQHALAGTVTAPSIAGFSISSAISVIEPPSIGIGGVGASASTAQVRAFIHVKFNSNNIPLIGTLASALAKTSISIDLPIAIDLVYAKATVASLCTETSGTEHATFNVNSSVLKMCVGGVTQANAFSTAGSCDQIPNTGVSTPLMQVTVAGLPIASVGNPFVITGLPANGTGTLAAGQSANIPSGGTPLDIGSTVSNAFDALTTALLTQATTSSSSTGISLPLATDLWNNNAASATGLTPNLNQLSAALNQLSSTTTGLQGFLQNTTGQVGTMLGSALTLNVPSLLTGTGNVLGGVVNLLGGLLSQTGCALGSQTACIGAIQNAMAGSTGGATPVPNSLVAVLGFVVQTLQGPLNQLGSQVLTPALKNVLGVELGVSTVTLQALQCHGVQLVY